MTENKGNYYIIADHLRTVLFALADGGTFEPRGRGYILRKLVKRASLTAYLLGLNILELEKISERLIGINSVYYPHLLQKKSFLISELKKQIEKETDLINQSNQKLNRFNLSQVEAKTVFRWYDSEGIPLELIKSHFQKQNCPFPEEEFNQFLELQKKGGLEDRKKKKITAF
ncbi:MAG: alanyl-tRNA synthase [Mycoplasmataceae bacterium RC_NB112A]|nr:MAG: alanyl-tRNA synthase [Mycoplasmataceae bacterium RC_NB112A]